jgi:dihydroflavonol-4-reductase
MKTLLTGASGFLGSAVLRQLIQAGHTVRALLRPESDRRLLEDLPVEICLGDMTQQPTLTSAVRGCNALLHVAADYRLWVPDPAAMYEANVAGTRHLMLAAMAAGLSRIVYTSSVAVLGISASGQPGDEDTPSCLSDMIGHYKRSKFLAEAEVRQLAETHQLPVVIVNPSAPVGPRDIKPTPTGQMILDAAAGRMPAYVDTGLNIAHVDDIAYGHLLALKHGQVGRRYILGGENLTLKEILIRIAQITGKSPPQIRLPHNLILPIAHLAEGWARCFNTGAPFLNVDSVRMAKKRMFFSSQRARQELGYDPRPVNDAFIDAIAWYEKNGYLDNGGSR